MRLCVCLSGLCAGRTARLPALWWTSSSSWVSPWELPSPSYWGNWFRNVLFAFPRVSLFTLMLSLFSRTADFQLCALKDEVHRHPSAPIGYRWIWDLPHDEDLPLQPATRGPVVHKPRPPPVSMMDQSVFSRFLSLILIRFIMFQRYFFVWCCKMGFVRSRGSPCAGGLVISSCIKG